MRQLSAPVRWAAATALTIAASTGCMSVGENDAGAPGPSRSAGPQGADADPAADTVPDPGRAGRRGGDAHPHSDRAVPGATPRPGASDTAPETAPAGPHPEPAAPDPTRGAGALTPTPTPSTPGPGEPPPTVPEPPVPPSPTPDPEPDPEPTDPPEPSPSTSPAAQFRAHALSGREVVRPLRTPEASPQVGPV
ncbi:hypothetical protein ACFV2V_20165 [Streptomyces sp. NPDC059698]|uniref:hypothetical protein n=1 Tax=unclassified Streptomyces TaxID=2593676 RepID=UPI00093F634C|nr:hypothetical protein [Streptomyces sp. CB02366]OKJ38288.1 hypothetical protein AMK24_11620 [Streptomyces sp. CB02366]